MVRKIIRRKKKKMNTTKILATLMGMMFLATYAMAYGPPYVIDGDLTTDWGVQPFVDWVPKSPTADYVLHDFNGSNYLPGPHPLPYGGELFDLEAMYFDDYYSPSTGGMAYIASVVSMNDPSGYPSYYMGDIAIDIDNNPATGMYGYEYGIKVDGPNRGQVCYMPVWSAAVDIPSNGPVSFTCNGSSSVVKGFTTVEYKNSGINDWPAGCNPVGGHCQPNYIIETSVKKLWIGLPEKDQVSKLHLTQNCGNDVINLIVDWDYSLPEFVSVGVPLLVLVLAPALAFVLVRRRKQ